jgi:hypothetical protein
MAELNVRDEEENLDRKEENNDILMKKLVILMN